MRTVNLPQFIAVVTDHNDSAKVLGRAGASTKPLAASRAIRNAVNNLMAQHRVYADKLTSDLGSLGLLVYGQAAPAYQSQYEAMIEGGRYGV